MEGQGELNSPSPGSPRPRPKAAPGRKREVTLSGVENTSESGTKNSNEVSKQTKRKYQRRNRLEHHSSEVTKSARRSQSSGIRQILTVSKGRGGLTTKLHRTKVENDWIGNTSNITDSTRRLEYRKKIHSKSSCISKGTASAAYDEEEEQERLSYKYSDGNKFDSNFSSIGRLHKSKENPSSSSIDSVDIGSTYREGVTALDIGTITNGNNVGINVNNIDRYGDVSKETIRKSLLCTINASCINWNQLGVCGNALQSKKKIIAAEFLHIVHNCLQSELKEHDIFDEEIEFMHMPDQTAFSIRDVMQCGKPNFASLIRVSRGISKYPFKLTKVPPVKPKRGGKQSEQLPSRTRITFGTTSLADISGGSSLSNIISSSTSNYDTCPNIFHATGSSSTTDVSSSNNAYVSGITNGNMLVNIGINAKNSNGNSDMEVHCNSCSVGFWSNQLSQLSTSGCWSSQSGIATEISQGTSVIGRKRKRDKDWLSQSKIVTGTNGNMCNNGIGNHGDNGISSSANCLVSTSSTTGNMGTFVSNSSPVATTRYSVRLQQIAHSNSGCFPTKELGLSSSMTESGHAVCTVQHLIAACSGTCCSPLDTTGSLPDGSVMGNVIGSGSTFSLCGNGGNVVNSGTNGFGSGLYSACGPYGGCNGCGACSCCTGWLSSDNTWLTQMSATALADPEIVRRAKVARRKLLKVEEYLQMCEDMYFGCINRWRCSNQFDTNTYGQLGISSSSPSVKGGQSWNRHSLAERRIYALIVSNNPTSSSKSHNPHIGSSHPSQSALGPNSAYSPSGIISNSVSSSGIGNGNPLADLAAVRLTPLELLTSPIRKPHVLDLWGPKETALFEAAICKVGKDFNKIQRIIQTKSTKEIVDFYYLWKKTNRYKAWKEYRGLSQTIMHPIFG